MLDVTFDDELWEILQPGSVHLFNRAGDGLGGSGFTLVKTGKNTGVFKVTSGSARFVQEIGSGVVISAMGTDIGVNW